MSDIAVVVGGVYPRVCGGTGETPEQTKKSGGLSPRVRGNRPYIAKCQWGERSIPACAGEPCRAWRSVGRARVYPRVCGGTLDDGDTWMMVAGLSPRVRGNRGLSTPRGRWRGSIPACAGEPRGAGCPQGV